MDTKVAAMDGALGSSGSCTKRPLGVAKHVLDITVLLGGPSSEREVSQVSGSAIADALVRLGHRVTRSDISPSNTAALDRAGMDVVFIALHGEFGESGEVQDLCEARRLRYIGSPPAASRLAMDKSASKRVFRSLSIKTADWVVIEAGHGEAKIARMLAEMPPPVVVKPVDGGSSVDITIAKDAATCRRAVDACLTRYGRVMVERFIDGREFTVGILGERALPIIEIRPAREFYDYTAKYTDCGTQYLFDHGLDDSVVRAMQQAAIAAHVGLGCRDMSRVDFILDRAGVPHILEINTIPGFTGHSLLPMAAAKAGIGFDELVGAIVEMAMKR